MTHDLIHPRTRENLTHLRPEARNLDQLIIWITQSLDLRLRSPAARWRNGQVLLMMAMLALHVSHLAFFSVQSGAFGQGSANAWSAVL